MAQLVQTRKEIVEIKDNGPLLPTLHLFRYQDTWQQSSIVDRLEPKVTTVYEAYMLKDNMERIVHEPKALKQLKRIYHFKVVDKTHAKNSCM